MHNHNMGKMLPEIPDMDTQLALSAKMIDKRQATPKGSHCYGSYFLEYSLMAEYQLLQKQRLPGIYCLPAHSTPLTWWGVLFIRQGPYQGAVLRFQVLIPDNYPDGDCPRVVFEGPVFHPHVDPATHELNVKQGFHRWKRNVNHIWQLLLYIRRIFYKVEVNSADTASNKEAATLWLQEREEFSRRVRQCVEDWTSRLYTATSEDLHYIRFSEFDPALHESARQELKQGGGSSSGSSSSLHLGGAAAGGGGNNKSYMKTGSLTIFSDITKVESDGPRSLPK